MPRLQTDCLSLSIEVHTDSNWADCQGTRRSTSGVVVQMCGSVVSPIRAEFSCQFESRGELYAIISGSLEAPRINNLMVELMRQD